MTASRDGLVRRSLRRFVLGSGPLKRRSDRLETVGRFVVLVSFLAAPPLAVATMTTTTAHLQSVAAVEAAERSRAQAVLLQDAPPPTPAAGGSAADGYSVDANPSSVMPVRAHARWTAPGGTRREGTVLAEPGTPAGRELTVWVDREGDITKAPLDPAAISLSAAITAAEPLIGLPLLVWTCHLCFCFVLNARRGHRWAQDWAAVEPEWNSRFR